MINPAFEILNQRGTPMFFSDIFANRPAAGVVGRIFISTDTLVLYRDTGTTWDEISGSTFSGSLAAGQVAFGSAANTIAGSNNLFWNNANSRLGINQTSPADSLDINGGQRISVNSGSTAKLSLYTGILNNTASTSPSFIEFWQRSNRTISMGLQTNSRFVINNNFDFTGSELFTIFTTSNVGIGTGATDSGHRFQVNGQTELRTTAVQYQLRLTDQNGFKWDLFAVANVTNTDLRFVDTGGAQRVTFFNGGNVSIGNNNNNARLSITGFGTTNASSSLTIANSAGTQLMRVGDDGFTEFSLAAGGIRIDRNNNSLVIDRGSFGVLRDGVNSNFSVSSVNGIQTSSTHNIVNNPITIAPTSGTANYNQYNIVPTINQTGGANGITRAIFISPTITSAADWRSIEWTNNTGVGLYGSGTAPNCIFGNLNVGSGDNPGAKIYSTGDIYFLSGNRIGSGNNAASYNSVWNRIQFYDPSTGDMTITMHSNTWWLRHQANASISGRLLVGTVTDSGQTLQVAGDAYIKGSGNTSGTTSLTVQNSDGTNLLRLRNDLNTSINYLRLGNSFSTSPYLFPFTTNAGVPNVTGTNLSFYSYTGSNSATNGVFTITGDALTQTSGNHSVIYTNLPFTPTSGTATFSSFRIIPVINQTGGANGISRGLLIEPTLTAAAAWRSIEWSNNSGYGLYGSGTATNFLNGNLQIGSTTATALDGKLQVTGFSYFADTRTYSTGTIQSATFDKQLTIPNGTSVGGGVALSSILSGGNTTFAGSATISDGSPFATTLNQPGYVFSAAGATITMTQSTGLRSATAIQAGTFFGGTNSGTITHVSSLQTNGFYNANTGSITPVITNAYQLLINDLAEFGHTFTFTNRWGIYQAGANDRNYFAGNLLVGTSTDSGNKVRINGSVRIDGQTSGTAGGSSGQHLIINCDGTTYKIALLNP